MALFSPTPLRSCIFAYLRRACNVFVGNNKTDRITKLLRTFHRWACYPAELLLAIFCTLSPPFTVSLGFAL